MSNASVAVGPPMPPDEEQQHKQRLAEQAADEAEAAVVAIEAKLAGMKERLATAKADAKRLRKEADEGVKG
jgi:molecular chaperone GrpE (heat shock protein)